MMKELKGVCSLYSETGTEGEPAAVYHRRRNEGSAQAFWALQDGMRSPASSGMR